MTDTSPPTPAPPSAAAKLIAQGGNPPWEQTFPHPRHGELTFRSQLPRAAAILRHQVAIDARLEAIGDLANARNSTIMLAGALAGLELIDSLTGEATMMVLPEVSRKETPGENGGITVERTFYDAAEEPNPQFVIDVWMAYSAWRASILEELDAVKGPSGETDGSASSTPSTAPSVSPSTTPA